MVVEGSQHPVRQGVYPVYQDGSCGVVGYKVVTESNLKRYSFTWLRAYVKLVYYYVVPVVELNRHHADGGD